MKAWLTIILLLVSGAWLVGMNLCHAQEKPSEDIRAQLLRACETGNVADVNRLLNTGADPNAADSNHKTALMLAAEYEDTSVAKQGISSQAMVKVLLNRGAKVNIVSDNDETALMKAVSKNNDAAVKLLLNNGVTVHVQIIDKNTIVVSSGDLTSKPLPQLRLHVGEQVAEAQWLPADKKAIGGMTAWKRPADTHYRNMLALLKAVASPTRK